MGILAAVTQLVGAVHLGGVLHRPIAILADAITVSPSASGLPGTAKLLQLLNGLDFDAVMATIAGFAIGLGYWALSSHTNNYQGASRGRAAVIVCAGAALLLGFGPPPHPGPVQHGPVGELT